MGAPGCLNARYITFSKNSFFSIGASEIDGDTTAEELDGIINRTLDEVLVSGFDEGRIEGLLNETALMYKQIKTRSCVMCRSL